MPPRGVTDDDLEASAPAVDPELRAQDALDRAYRHLAKRDRTETEIRRHLGAACVEPATIDETIATLVEQGYVDDARYAARYAEDRRTLDDWGPERIARRLAQFGVPAEHVGAAVGARDADRELEAAVALLRRRFPVAPDDARGRERALGVLARKGYDLELAYAAVRALGRSAG